MHHTPHARLLIVKSLGPWVPTAQSSGSRSNVYSLPIILYFRKYKVGKGVYKFIQSLSTIHIQVLIVFIVELRANAHEEISLFSTLILSPFYVAALLWPILIMILHALCFKIIPLQWYKVSSFSRSSANLRGASIIAFSKVNHFCHTNTIQKSVAYHCV